MQPTDSMNSPSAVFRVSREATAYMMATIKMENGKVNKEPAPIYWYFGLSTVMICPFVIN
ncbi:hypothetical protein D3C77_466350 [compost metagenome]